MKMSFDTNLTKKTYIYQKTFAESNSDLTSTKYGKTEINNKRSRTHVVQNEDNLVSNQALLTLS